MDTVLYVGPPSPGADALGVLAVAGARRSRDGSVVLDGASGARSFHQVSEPEAAMAFLRDRAVDALVVDSRVAPFADAGDNPSEEGPFALTRAGRLLSLLFPDGELFAGIQRDRVLGIVGPGEAGVEAAHRLGGYGLHTVLYQPGWDALARRLEPLLDRRRTGRIAVCLAGGGIEGLLYELGVLRALEAFLADRSIVDLDLFCGISAGAILGACLANGVGPDEIGRGLAGGSARIRPIEKSELFDLNLREAGGRVASLAGELVRGGAGPRGVVSSLARALPGGVFAGNGLRGYLHEHLNQPGMSDRFDQLRRPLFVGATDQDTSQAVVFGEEGFRHVPVHKAVRASAALVPFYAPEVIDGRYYTDGAFTRTTNMRVAVRQGATLVILVDPLVPSFSQTAGHVHSRGGIYATMQGLKALINGRFDKAVRAIREMYPDVSFYLFRPHGDEMRILSGSPMKYFYRREVEEVAYRHTFQKIRASLPELTRDFARHGVTLRDPEASRGEGGRAYRPLSFGVGL